MRAALVMSFALATSAGGCMAGMGAGHAAQASPPAQPAPEAAGTGMGGMPMEACPMAVPGTQVAAADTAGGESVTFTTSAERAADLRARVHAMAEMHNRHQQGGGMDATHGGMGHGGMMGGGMMGSSTTGEGQMAMMPPPSRATVEDVEGGARITVTPNDPADVDRLRSTVRTHAQHMQESGTCAMNAPSR